MWHRGTPSKYNAPTLYNSFGAKLSRVIKAVAEACCLALDEFPAEPYVHNFNSCCYIRPHKYRSHKFEILRDVHTSFVERQKGHFFQSEGKEHLRKCISDLAGEKRIW